MTQPEGPQHEIVTGLGDKFEKPPEDSFELIGRLMFNAFIRAPDEYAEAAGGAKPIKWRQEYVAVDVVRDDGTPATFSSSPSVTKGDGVTFLGEGMPWDKLALMWKALVGIRMNPEDPRSAVYLGHFFRLKSLRIKAGKNRKTGEEFVVRVLQPIEDLGTDFVYQGDVRKLPPREGGDEKSSAPATPPPPPAQDDDAVAQKVALVIHGSTRDTAQAAIFASDLKTVPTLFGKSLIAELTPPVAPLVDVLVAKGLIQLKPNGLIEAIPAAPE